MDWVKVAAICITAVGKLIKECFNINVWFFWSGISTGWKLVRKGNKMIWLVRWEREIGIVFLNNFIRPIARSTCIRREAIFWPDSISCVGNCCLPSKKGGMFSSTPKSLNSSLTINPYLPLLILHYCLVQLQKNHLRWVKSVLRMIHWLRRPF